MTATHPFLLSWSLLPYRLNTSEWLFDCDFGWLEFSSLPAFTSPEKEAYDYR